VLLQTQVIGRRIANIFGDLSLSDEQINFGDFIYQLDNGVCFRMPHDDGSGHLFADTHLTASHSALEWPRGRWWFYRRKLWSAKIVDVLVPADEARRYVDSGVIALASGWFVVQSPYGPIGIMPNVSVVHQTGRDEPMVSVWQT
jgi:hypothetical protein